MRKNISFLSCLALASCIGTAFAEEGTSNGLWGWNVSAGGNIGFGLKTDLRTMPVNALRFVPALHPSPGTSKREAMSRQTPKAGGDRVTYGRDAWGDYYVDPESSWGETEPNETINWRMPESMHVGDSFVVDGGSWGEVVSSSMSSRSVDDQERAAAYGASVELSHPLWMSEDGVWGVDIAFGLTWMMSKSCYRSDGVAMTQNASVERGDVITRIPADCLTDPYSEPEDDNTWGAAAYDGSQTTGRNDYLIELDRITTVARTLESESYSGTMYLSSRGDYEEWEISAMLRPWYDVNEWMCLHGMLGIGVTRSSFEYVMNAMYGGKSIYRSAEEFDEWRCYGIAGAGVLFRVWRFDVSCDGLFRWCQQDMNINGRDVQGTLTKPWAVLRFGLSYAF